MLPMKMIVPPPAWPCMMALACWAVEGGDQVEADDALVKGGDAVSARAMGRPAGVVDHHVEAAVAGLISREEAFSDSSLAHVGGDELGLGRRRLRQHLRGLPPTPAPARRRRQETAGDACTDALGAAGDRGRPAAAVIGRGLIRGSAMSAISFSICDEPESRDWPDALRRLNGRWTMGRAATVEAGGWSIDDARRRRLA